MEYFTKAKAVRLRSHLDKYLVSDENKETISQSRSKSSESKWFIELVEDNSQAIHLKNIHGKYLTARDYPSLLGMNGKRVIQTESYNKFDLSIRWFPIRDGSQVKLKSFEGKFLRANGGKPPWRNTVTTDIVSDDSATKIWFLWDIETDDDDSDSETSFPNLQSHGLSISTWFPMYPKLSSSQLLGIDFFPNAKAVRLRSHHQKYLLADDDEESVGHYNNGSVIRAKWIVELLDGGEFIRLRSCYGKYLTASNELYLLGMSGRKVTQSLPSRVDSSIEWEPIRVGHRVKLKTKYGTFLRANDSLFLKNSVIHDIPSKSQELFFWDVDILEALDQQQHDQHYDLKIKVAGASIRAPDRPTRKYHHQLHDFKPSLIKLASKDARKEKPSHVLESSAGAIEYFGRPELRNKQDPTDLRLKHPRKEKPSHVEFFAGAGTIEDFGRPELRNKQDPTDLSLIWEGEESNNDSVLVLQGLQPHPNLEILVIENYGGVKLPKWMSSISNSLPNLVEVYLSNCNKCEKLPSLGMLPSLRVLWIYGMMSIKCLGQEFYHQEDEEEAQETTTFFPLLTRFQLGDMDSLEEWVAPPPPPYISFPVLETLCVIGCCKLTSIPDFRLFTSLRELTIEECDKLIKESTSIQREEQRDDSSEEYQSPNSTCINRYLVKQITSGKNSGIQDIAALETVKLLHVRNLENVIGGLEDAERTKLKDKQHLEDLHLSWNYDNDDECIDTSANDEKVLEGLQPHPGLKILTISGFEGYKLPKWMGLSNCLPHLVELYLFRCNSCEQLPALGMLPCLIILQIKGMNSVKCLAEEFYYKQEESSGSINNKEMNAEIQATTIALSSGFSFFPSLIELSLIDMSIFQEWAPPPRSFNSFLSLESLVVSGCLRLKSISLSSCSSLKSLELCNTNDDVVNSILADRRVERLTSLTSVSIQDSPQLEFFPVVLLQKDSPIQSLRIGSCSKFQGFRILDNNNDNKEFQAKLSSDTGFNTTVSSLCSLKLTDCPALTSLPDLRNCTCLTQLWIEDCDKLKRSILYDLKSLHNLQTLYIDRFIDLSQE